MGGNRGSTCACLCSLPQAGLVSLNFRGFQKKAPFFALLSWVACLASAHLKFATAIDALKFYLLLVKFCDATKECIYIFPLCLCRYVAARGYYKIRVFGSAL